MPKSQKEKEIQKKDFLFSFATDISINLYEPHTLSLQHNFHFCFTQKGQKGFPVNINVFSLLKAVNFAISSNFIHSSIVKSFHCTYNFLTNDSITLKGILERGIFCLS